MNFFIPKEPRDFSMQVIEHGMNHVHQIGSGIWKIGAYVDEYNQVLFSARGSAPFVLTPAIRFQCLLSAFLFPDRIPNFIDEEYFTA